MRIDPADPKHDAPELSVIVPMLNEEGNVRLLASRVQHALARCCPNYELLYVDDGSADGSVREVRALEAESPNVRLIALARNFGKEAAMLAGYDYARGRASIVVDADLQQPPELFPRMLDLWREGFDVVDAVREETIGISPLRKAASDLFYRLNERLLGVPLSSHTADFRLMDRAVVEAVRQCRENHRFNRALVAWTGFRRTAITYKAADRHAGTTKWSWRGLVRYAMDGTLSFSVRPLRVAGLGGGLISGLSFAYLMFVAVLRLVKPEAAGANFGYASLVGMIGAIGGFQLLAIWLLGEYVGRIYEQVKGRPSYVVRDAEGPVIRPGVPRGPIPAHHLNRPQPIRTVEAPRLAEIEEPPTAS